MTYRWVDHTSELELVIESTSEEAVFLDAFAAFVELAGDGTARGDDSRSVDLRAHECDALLADWLEELVYLADAQRFVPTHAEELRLETHRLGANVRGHVGEPRTLVKAVTRHRLAFERSAEGGFHARVVLDV